MRQDSRVIDLVKTIRKKGGVDEEVRAAAASEPQPTIDAVVMTLLETKKYWSKKSRHPHLAVEAAKLGPSRPVLDALVQACLDIGWLADGAVRSATLRGESVSQEEVDAAIEKCLESHELPRAFRITALGPSRRVIDALLSACVKDGWGQIGAQAIERFGAEAGVIDALLLRTLEEMEAEERERDPDQLFSGISFDLTGRDKVEDAFEVGRRCSVSWVEFGGENLPFAGDIDYINERWLTDWPSDCREAWKRGLEEGWESAREASAVRWRRDRRPASQQQILGLVSRGASVEAVSALLLFLGKYRRHDLLDKALPVAPPRAVEPLVELLVEEGDTFRAREAAQCAGRALSASEIDSLVRSNAAKGDVTAVFETVMSADRPLTAEEEDSLVENFKKLVLEPSGYEEKNTSLSWYHRDSLNDALVGARGGTEQAIEDLVLYRSPLGFTNETLRRRDASGGDLSVEEIDAQAEAALGWGKTHDAIHVAELGASDAVREVVQQKAIKDAPSFGINLVLRAAEIRGRGLTSTEEAALFDRCIKRGSLIYALRAALMTNREFSAQGLVALVHKYADEFPALGDEYVYTHTGRVPKLADLQELSDDPNAAARRILDGELDGIVAWGVADKEQVLRFARDVLQSGVSSIVTSEELPPSKTEPGALRTVLRLLGLRD